MTLELVAEVPLSLLNLSRFQDAIVVHAECDDERVVKIFQRGNDDHKKALDQVPHLASTPRGGLVLKGSRETFTAQGTRVVRSRVVSD